MDLIHFLNAKIDGLEERIVQRIDKLEDHVDGIRMSKAQLAGSMAVIAVVMQLGTSLFLQWYFKG